MFKNKNILITGASGYIGKNLSAKLIELGAKVTGLTRKSENVDQSISWVIGDLGLPEQWFSKLINKPDYIFHLSSQTNLNQAENDPVADYYVNVKAVKNFLDFLVNSKMFIPIIFSSTATVVGLVEKNQLPVDEDFPENPITVYDQHKLIVEKLLKEYHDNSNIPSISLRLANVYGPGINSRNSNRGILNFIVNKALRGENLEVWGTGNYIRDYIYIEDVLEALLIAAIKVSEAKGKFFYIGSGSGKTIKEAFQLVIDIASETTKNNNVKITLIEEPNGLFQIEKRNFIANTNNFTQLTGWKPKYSLPKGISKTVSIFWKDYQK